MAHKFGRDATPEDAAEGVAALFDVVGSGKVRPHVGARYPLGVVTRDQL